MAESSEQIAFRCIAGNGLPPMSPFRLVVQILSITPDAGNPELGTLAVRPCGEQMTLTVKTEACASFAVGQWHELICEWDPASQVAIELMSTHLPGEFDEAAHKAFLDLYVGKYRTFFTGAA